MKSKLILIFLILFTNGFSFGQEKVKKNELSISVLKISTLPFTSFSSFQVINVGINILYKHRFYDKFYLRAIQSFYRYNSTNSLITSKNQDYIQEINTSTGLEYWYFKTKRGKFIFYSGFDVTGFINSGQFSFVDGGGNFAGNSKQKNTGIGLQPFLGLTFYPIKRLTFSLEGSLLMGIQKQKELFLNFKGFVQPTPNNGFSRYSQLFLIRHASVGWLF